MNITEYENRIIMDLPNGTITFKLPTNEDEGTYQCFAKNKHGFASFAPHIVRKSYLDGFKDDSVHVVEVTEGSPLKIECNAPNGYPTPSIYWMIQTRDSGEIQTIDDSPRITFDPHGNLWFSSVNVDDALKNAQYTCAATSSFRNQYKLGKRVQLKVIRANKDNDGMKIVSNSPIMQYVTSPHVVALRGQRTELFCIYGGEGALAVSWKINGTTINYDKRIKEKNFGKSLLIRDTRLDDKGLYSCDVSDGANGNQSSLISVDVLAAPYFISHPMSKAVVENDTMPVEFSCEVRGVPEPEIIWTHNGNIIEFTSSSAAQTDRVSASKNKLTIKEVIKSDGGNYGCNATNKIGFIYRDFYLDVVKPQKIFT